MKVTVVEAPLVKRNDDLFVVIKNSVKKLPEESVLVVASKIVSFSQGRIVERNSESKEEKHNLAKKEADYYLKPHSSKYNLILTIKNNTLAVNAGVDESNANGGFVLWPKDLQKITNKIWRFLRQHYRVKKVGVVVTDSRTNPLRWGVIGTALAHCGFKALHDYRGQKDLFDREIKMSQINVSEAIAVAAVLEMGEVDEKTPLAIVEDVKKIKFQKRPPTEKELAELRIKLEDDVYAPLLTAVRWKKKKQ